MNHCHPFHTPQLCLASTRFFAHLWQHSCHRDKGVLVEKGVNEVGISCMVCDYYLCTKVKSSTPVLRAFSFDKKLLCLVVINRYTMAFIIHLPYITGCQRETLISSHLVILHCLFVIHCHPIFIHKTLKTNTLFRYLRKKN